jgi:PIN domain nuclease of toxin-antitoxin system
MPALLLDTHAVVWYLSDDERLSSKALDAIETAIREGSGLFISVITLVEIIYLVEKGRLPEAAMQRLCTELDAEEPAIQVAVLDMGVARALGEVPRDAVPDMPDRIVVATAATLGLTLVTRDDKIARSGCRTVW